jgi:hypothetical protein
MRDLIFEDQHRHSKHVETVFSLHVKLTVNFFLSFDLSVDGFIVGALLAVAKKRAAQLTSRPTRVRRKLVFLKTTLIVDQIFVKWGPRGTKSEIRNVKFR